MPDAPSPVGVVVHVYEFDIRSGRHAGRPEGIYAGWATSGVTFEVVLALRLADGRELRAGETTQLDMQLLDAYDAGLIRALIADDPIAAADGDWRWSMTEELRAAGLDPADPRLDGLPVTVDVQLLGEHGVEVPPPRWTGIGECQLTYDELVERVVEMDGAPASLSVSGSRGEPMQVLDLDGPAVARDRGHDHLTLTVGDAYVWLLHRDVREAALSWRLGLATVTVVMGAVEVRLSSRA